jgi:hypothetical protein
MIQPKNVYSTVCGTVPVIVILRIPKPSTNVAANLKFDTCQISGLPRHDFERHGYQAG